MPFYARPTLICEACRGQILEGAHVVRVERVEVTGFGYSYDPHVETDPLPDALVEYFHGECYENPGASAAAVAPADEGGAA